MQPYPKSLLRAATVAAAILSLGAGASACPKEAPVAKDFPIFAAFIGVPKVDVIATSQTINFRGVGVANGMDDVLCSSDDETVFTTGPIFDSKTGTWALMTGTYTITGDDGDSIVIWISTPPQKFSYDMAAGHVEFAGTFIVVKGTGRYRNATGTGTFVGSADVVPLPDKEQTKPGHFLLQGNGRWAIWGTLSGVKEGHCGR